MTKTGWRGMNNAPPPGLPDPMPGQNVIRDDPKLRRKIHLDEPQAYYNKLHKTIPVHALPIRPENERVPKFDIFALEHGTHPRVDRYIKSRRALLGTAGGRKQEVRKSQYIRDEEWAHIVEPDQSACIVDADTGEIQAYVVRDFFEDQGIMDALNETSKGHCILAKDVRVSI